MMMGRSSIYKPIFTTVETVVSRPVATLVEGCHSTWGSDLLLWRAVSVSGGSTSQYRDDDYIRTGTLELRTLYSCSKSKIYYYKYSENG